MHSIKGIALSTLAYMILALITLVLLISLIGDKIYSAMKDVYCSILKGVRLVLPLPAHLKTDVPEFCKKETATSIKVVELETQNAERIAFNIAAYIAACWELTGKAEVGEDRLCYEIIIKKVDGEVTADDVSRVLADNGQNIPFIWRCDTIDRATTIAIKYNSAENKIEVI